jgi:N,N-dimethylformamidase beta subunit-like protein
VWQPLFPNGRDHEVEGYASETSVAPGQVLHLHVSVNPATRYQIQIIRLGWYRGFGGRLIRCVPSCSKYMRGTPQPIAAPAADSGLLRLTWPTSTTVRVPAAWVTGYYIAKLVLGTNPTQWPVTGHSSDIPFIVREPATVRPSKILVVSAANTEQAYNNWGGKSLYNFNSTGAVSANHVSFDRPYAAELWHYEVPVIRFIESQAGLDLSYATDVDVDLHPEELLRHKLVLVVGHSEYWSRRMRDAYENARNRGVNLAFFGGNYGDWQIRYDNGDRTIVEYRSATTDPDPDPLDKTTKFSLLQPPRPQCQILGTQFVDNIAELPRQFRINAAAINDAWFAGTGFKAGDTFNAIAGEADIAAPAGCLPYPVTTFFTSTLSPNFAPAIRYRTASGATVFSVGSYALALTGLENDKRLQRFAANALTSLSR